MLKLTKMNGKVKKHSFDKYKHRTDDAEEPPQKIRFAVKNRHNGDNTETQSNYNMSEAQKLLQKLRALGRYILTGDVEMTASWVTSCDIHDYFKLYDSLLKKSQNMCEKAPIKPQKEEGKLIVDSPMVISKTLPPYTNGRIIYYTKETKEMTPDGEEIMPAGSISFELGIGCNSYKASSLK